MQIKKIEMISFGKFKNKIIEFKSGLNIICGDNESGKSTILHFIYVMFYGFGDSRGKGLSLREKFTPWDGSFCEGKLTFIDNNGDTITIYRKSGLVKKYDICKIFNAATGEELQFPASNFIEISSDTFLKTICMHQKDCILRGTNEEIIQKLSNIALSGDENISYEKARKILENSRREILPQRGEGGLLFEVNREISRLEREKADREKILNEIESTKLLLQHKKQTLKELQEKLASIASDSYGLRIAHLQGRIEERNTVAPSPRLPGKIKLYFLTLSVIFFALFITLITRGNSFYYIPLSLGIISLVCTLFIRNKNISVTSESLTEELSQLKLKEKDRSKELCLIEKKISETEKSVSELESLAALKSSMISQNECTRLTYLYSKKHKLEKNLKVFSNAIKALDLASEKMKNNFTPALNALASAYFKKLCFDKYPGIFCDEDFDIKVNSDIPRNCSFFSGGLIDQMYFALRLALTDMLFKEKSIFLLLDQPFMQYDESRRKNAENLLESLSENRQIILFENYVERFSSNKNTEILT